MSKIIISLVLSFSIIGCSASEQPRAMLKPSSISADDTMALEKPANPVVARSLQSSTKPAIAAH